MTSSHIYLIHLIVFGSVWWVFWDTSRNHRIKPYYFYTECSSMSNQSILYVCIMHLGTICAPFAPYQCMKKIKIVYWKMCLQGGEKHSVNIIYNLMFWTHFVWLIHKCCPLRLAIFHPLTVGGVVSNVKETNNKDFYPREQHKTPDWTMQTILIFSGRGHVFGKWVRAFVVANLWEKWE